MGTPKNRPKGKKIVGLKKMYTQRRRPYKPLRSFRGSGRNSLAARIRHLWPDKKTETRRPVPVDPPEVSPADDILETVKDEDGNEEEQEEKEEGKDDPRVRSTKSEQNERDMAVALDSAWKSIKSTLEWNIRNKRLNPIDVSENIKKILYVTKGSIPQEVQLLLNELKKTQSQTVQTADEGIPQTGDPQGAEQPAYR